VAIAPNWEDAMKLAGLDWQVVKESLQDVNGVVVPTFGIFREDTRQFLGAVGDQYTPIQNRYAFDFCDTLIAANGGTKYESAGALYQGQTVWCLARIPKGDGEIVPGDKQEMYLLFTSSHDGSKSATAKLVTVRVVCNNTLQMALRGGGQAIKIRHMPSAEKKLDFAKTFLSAAVKQADDVRAKLRELAERNMTKNTFTSILDRIFPVKKEEEKVNTRRDNTLAEIATLYQANDGKDGIPSIQGSAYNLLNAITQWTDHKRGVRLTDKRAGMNEESARAENALFGTGSMLKENALEIILEETEKNSRRSYSTTYAPVAVTPQINSPLIDEILANTIG
jgi:phage/plasmid-like protein (TIGR03299 family)